MATFDPQAVAKRVIEDQVNQMLGENDKLQISVNLSQLADMTGVSTSNLEQNFVPLGYVAKLERRAGAPGKRGKRVWLFPEVRDAWRRYLDERS
ncbi:hypothetical protein ACFQET_08970 [Levilactobacillus tangyuanensis]|uniref:DNA-binding protein n=1 Tax=Levilactobacillus tangyuanensis TaxID=2486021 RepID=A0ABW1TR25_9LACO|nr:hypothetical protein [Levilactobacillus tangyuanensis]